MAGLFPGADIWDGDPSTLGDEAGFMMDTDYPEGADPQSVKVTPQQMGLGGSVALTDAASIVTDASLGKLFSVTLGGNRTLANPTNMQDGAEYVWKITQDGTGNRTLAYGNKFLFPGGAPTASTGAGDIDVIRAIYSATTDKLYAVMTKDYTA